MTHSLRCGSRYRSWCGMVAALWLMAAPAGAQVSTLSVSGRTNANPTVAARDDFMAVAWSAATVSSMDIYVATSRDAGRTWSAPVRVNQTVGDARVNGEQPPRVVLVPSKSGAPAIVVVWTAKRGSDTRLLWARSTNGGVSFGPTSIVPGSDAAGARGWQSATVDGAGRVSVLWLDHRGLAGTASTHMHGAGAGAASGAMSGATSGAMSGAAAGSAAGATAPAADPTERAGLSQVMMSSLDGTQAVSIARSVCYCCKTSIATVGTSQYAVWRHVYPGSQRDMALAVSRDRGRTFAAPVRVSEDHWQLDGCPDNGPSVAVDAQRDVHVVWPAPADGKPTSPLSVFYARSRDGAAFTPRMRVPTRGPAGHVQVVVTPDGAPLLAWDEVVGDARVLGMARITRSANGAPVVTPLAAPDTGAGQWYPALASRRRGVFAVWVRQQGGGSVIGVARVTGW